MFALGNTPELYDTLSSCQVRLNHLYKKVWRKAKVRIKW